MEDHLSIAKIVDLLGIARLQRYFGHENASTVSSWKIRGSIPVEYWPKIVEAAAAIGKHEIDYEALVKAHSARKESAA